MKEVTVKIISDEATISERFLIYEPLNLEDNDKHLLSLIESVKRKFHSPLIDAEVIIKVKMTWLGDLQRIEQTLSACSPSP